MRHIPRIEPLEERALPSLVGPANYPADAGPQGVALGDFNGDGKTDLLTVNIFGYLRPPLGKGDGTFQPSPSFSAVGIQPVAVATADFNGDGQADAATANLDGSVRVRLGQGNGSFQGAWTYPLESYNARSV